MTYQLNYRRIIIILLIGLIGVVGLFWYKEQTTNKVIPKRANFVERKIEWSKIYG
ncbi:hypothetical protein [Tissierella sp.]|uniref:hypothetical protein n=1 Tax=Tissierella sp. TaxID=41274 RepID=UPI00285A0772|nr:hypothetical protein [Tissierella sp.]MDR7857146.1 hypothetical protein [Tissierella sp.]